MLPAMRESNVIFVVFPKISRLTRFLANSDLCQRLSSIDGNMILSVIQRFGRTLFAGEFTGPV